MFILLNLSSTIATVSYCCMKVLCYINGVWNKSILSSLTHKQMSFYCADVSTKCHGFLWNRSLSMF